MSFLRCFRIRSNRDENVLLAEYKEALQQTQSYATLMRQDVAFATAVQGAIMAIVGPSLPITNLGHSLLLILAFTVAIYGRRSAKRLYWYMVSYLARAREIESLLGMQLISQAGEEIKKHSKSPATRGFTGYFTVTAVIWVIIGIWSLADYLLPLR